MPVQPTYPGVYIEEVSSGVRSIAGVSTSITAFVGGAKRGKVNEPIDCFNYGEFERRFGGMWSNSPMSYAVNDFYLNQGSHVIIVRLFKEKAMDANPSGVATITKGVDGALEADALKLVAENPGEWGNKLKVKISYPTDTEAAKEYVKNYPGIGENDLFEITVTDEGTNAVEKFSNVIVKDGGGARRVDRVLEESSNLIRFNPAEVLPANKPPEGVWEGQKGHDGDPPDEVDFKGSENAKTGIYALLKTDIFNILCIPPNTLDGNTHTDVWKAAAAFCAKQRAFLIIDSPSSWDDNLDGAAAKVKDEQSNNAIISLANAANAALYFPRIRKPDPEMDGQLGTFVPCGAIAGIMARTDTNRGVWKAPAGIEASIAGTTELTVKLTDDENGLLNPIGVNCLRTFPVIGRVAWGARTLRGADQLSDDYKYIPVRRLALFIEESLFRGTQWVVFEGNDEKLWAQIRLAVGSFMQRLFRQGAFQGTSAREAYLVKCDSETTTQDDINQGIVNIVVGFAPLQPAEFIILKIQQIRNAS